jgi:hypothetical protein
MVTIQHRVRDKSAIVVMKSKKKSMIPVDIVQIIVVTVSNVIIARDI